MVQLVRVSMERANGKVTVVLIASQRQKVEPQKRPTKQVVADHELQLLNHAPSALMCLSLDEQAFSYANKAALQLLGVSFDEAVDTLKADEVLGKATLEYFRRELPLSTPCEAIKNHAGLRRSRSANLSGSRFANGAR